MTIPLEEIRDFLIAIRRGWIKLEPVIPSEVIYPKWTASNGWKICVFDDAGDWDYIEWIETNDGRKSVYDDIYPESAYGENPVYEGEATGDEVEKIWRWSEVTR